MLFSFYKPFINKLPIYEDVQIPDKQIVKQLMHSLQVLEEFFLFKEYIYKHCLMFQIVENQPSRKLSKYRKRKFSDNKETTILLFLLYIS